MGRTVLAVHAHAFFRLQPSQLGRHQHGWRACTVVALWMPPCRTSITSARRTSY